MALRRTEMTERVSLGAETQTTFSNEKTWLSFKPAEARGQHSAGWVEVEPGFSIVPRELCDSLAKRLIAV